MTDERFREFVARLASHLGLEVAMDQIESPLEISIDERRVILDQDISAEQPEIVFYTFVGTIDERRELEVMRMLLEGNYLWSHTGGGTLGVNSETREVAFAYKLPVSAMPNAAAAGNVLAHFVTIAAVWAVYLQGGELELPDQDEVTLGGDYNRTSPSSFLQV